MKKLLKKNKLVYFYLLRLFTLLTSWKRRRMGKNLSSNGEKVMDDIIEMFKDSNFNYFFASGTALGLYRDGKTIDGDIDIDLGILKDEYFNWGDLDELMTNKGFVVTKIFTTHNIITEKAYKKNEVSIDVFIYINENGKAQTQAYYRIPGIEYKSNYQLTSIDLILPFELSVETINVNGKLVSLPSPIEKYLETLYTTEWKIPNPKWNDFESPSFFIDKTKFGEMQIKKEK